MITHIKPRMRCRWRIDCGTPCSSMPARPCTCWSCVHLRKGIPRIGASPWKCIVSLRNKAGHHAVAEAMSFMTVEAPELERLESEQRAEARRALPQRLRQRRPVRTVP